MKMILPISEYLEAMNGLENNSLSLDAALRPFGLGGSLECSKSLLNGHLLDYLHESLPADARIDCMDVASAMIDLGHTQAYAFLDSAPWILYLALKSADPESTPVPYAIL